MGGVPLVPRRMKTVGRFTAPDPVHAGATAEFTVEAYRLFGEHVRVVRDTKWLGLKYLYGISSALDGQDRIMPDALAELWRSGRIAPESLPAVLHAIEPTLTKSDYRLWAGTNMHRWIAAVVGAIALASAVLAWRAWPAQGWAVSALPSRMTLQQWLATPMTVGHDVKVREELAETAGVIDVTGVSRPHELRELAEDGQYQLAWLKDSVGHRLVLVGGYGRSLLPRVAPDGIVVRTDQTGLDREQLRRLADSLPGLDAEKVFWLGLYRSGPGSRTDVKVWGGLTAFLVLYIAAFWAFISWKKIIRRRQMDQWHAIAQTLAPSQPAPTHDGRDAGHASRERL